MDVKEGGKDGTRLKENMLPTFVGHKCSSCHVAAMRLHSDMFCTLCIVCFFSFWIY